MGRSIFTIDLKQNMSALFLIIINLSLDIKFQNYKEALFQGTDMRVKMNTFRSYGHQIYTEQITKTALSRADDKCFILDDQIHTRTFGHYKNI